MRYRDFEGSKLADEIVDGYSKAWKQSETHRKAAATRVAWVACPTLEYDMSVQEYVELFDRANSLKPAKYTWVAPESHYGHQEAPLEREEERMVA
ncbi:MAG TPA: hypothetical protein VJT81_05615 [Burkholderiales bacterium]|nr:hypothetical protein [Burkholderiales bacterium]